MITCAQAEALLSLAESLEACERQGLDLMLDEAGVIISTPGVFEYVSDLKGVQVRLAVNALIPKQET